MTTACTVCELHAESTFRVEGMDCHEEVAILERRLSRLTGLEALDADVLGQRLRIKYDASRLSTSAIAEAVAQTGMRAWLEHEAPVASIATAWRDRLVIASGVLLAAGLLLSVAAPGVPAWPAFLASAIAGGIPVVRRASVSVRAGVLDINVLMVIAVIGAVVLREWTEASSVVFLFALAQMLETRAMDRARGAIRALMELSPTEAAVRRGHGVVNVAIDAVRIGDIVLVKPGEKIPLDGEVAAGDSHVNQAPVTGESLPVQKTAGMEVFAGTINGRGALDVLVTRLRGDSTIARIIHLVERAQAQRAPSQTFVDRFARIYTPIVLVFAVLVAVVPPLAFAADWSTWFYRALVLLVISCPCALVISTPVSIVSALAAAARKGVLIKGGARLEQLATVRCVAFDKTGTLTKGRLHVARLAAFSGYTTDEVLRAAAALEGRSEHPIGLAIVRKAALENVTVPAVAGFQAIPGLGAEGFVDGRAVLVGNRRLLEQRGLQSAEFSASDGEFSSRGWTPIFVAVAGVPIGALAVVDEPREAAAESLQMLRALGIQKIAMLTGDHAAAAGAVAASLGIDDVRADLLPADKAAAVTQLREKYGTLAMVGDGVNDAPALATADVGIAMGVAGSAAALETADVALMADELPKVTYAIRLSRATARNIRANIAFSIALKAAFLVMAVSGLATLWMAVAADMGASLIVIANALRLLRE
ncbi:MAG TPA: cation-translocating P-type ATPase [Vicinamibacterales bacterium]|nr:cation-translocating P-type ATPase [Vicinamibacterales bacterium]